VAEERRHVLIKNGDASREVDEAVRALGSPAAAGLDRHFFVTRANQTVVMAASSTAPIVRVLLGGAGWLEPERSEGD
jgi:hypothetical protein